MGLSYLFVAVLAVAVTVFVLQNTAETTLRFLVWRLEAVPLATVVLVALAAGFLITGLPLWVQLRVWRSRAHALEAKARTLEASVAERDRRLGRPPQA